MNILNESYRWITNHSSTILTVIGSAGTVASTISGIKRTPKALMLLSDAQYKKQDDLTVFEKIRIVTPVYIPTILLCTASIVCIFGANALNAKRQASLISAYALLEQSYKNYRDKVVQLYGKDSDAKIINSIMSDNKDYISDESEEELFFDYYSLQYFNTTLDKLTHAQKVAEDILKDRGYLSLGEYYDLVGIETTPANYQVGWVVKNGGSLYGYSEIGFENTLSSIEDDLDCVIVSFSNEPDIAYYMW